MKRVVLNSLLIVSMIGMVACDEDNPLESSDGATELALGEYYMEAEGIVSYLYNLTDRAYNDSTFQASDSTTIWGIPVVGTTTSLMELRFGNGITGNDGITRKGKITVSESGSFAATGGSLSLAFDNFVVNDRAIGNNNTNMSIANDGVGSYSVGITDFGIANEFAYSGSKTISWTSGLSTPSEDDDQYNVGGSFSGSETETGNGIAGNVVEPLVYDRSCASGVVSGLVDFTLSGDSLAFNMGSVDFIKDDNCNNAAVITIETENGGKLVFPKTFNGF